MEEGEDDVRSHIMDSELLGGNFAPPEYGALFDDSNRVQKWLDLEAALAEAEAELGIIPKEAAAEIVSKCRVECLDMVAVAAEVRHTSHAIVPVVRALERACAGGHGEYAHYGATTQDVVDTGMMLQVKEAWALFLRDLGEIRETLAGHARTHRDTPMAGRTHGQQGQPITFGYKVAVWIDEVDRHLERFAEAEKRVLVGNLTGAVGTMAFFPEHGPEIQRRTMAKLGLGVPRICWHSSRDRVAELAHLLVQIAGTLGKIANEIYTLQKTEADELAEPFHMGKVGSSTMPHKQNPSTCELVAALARLVRGNLMPLTDALFQEHERDASVWRIEWAAIPEAVVYTGAMLTHMRRVLAGLTVRPDRMARNLDMLGGLLLSERVMVELGTIIGKQTAHELVYEVAMEAHASGTPFRDLLKAEPRVTVHLDAARIDALLDPDAYVGRAPQIVDEVVGD